ncbi:MAG: AmmeMemoRadiSam system protein B [Candidatus Methanomethylicia archaeon]
MLVRNPAVAGLFYEGFKEDLLKQIEWCFHHKLGPGVIPEVKDSFTGNLIGVIVPHAGYIYSGPVAAWGYKAIAENGKPESFIILGPNHSGMGAPIAIMREGIWKTPLGEVEIDKELSDELLKKSDILEDDFSAHINEHSIEVQLPFLQYLFGGIKFVPICLMLQNQEVSVMLGKCLSDVVKDRKVVIIASTDFSHYERYETAFKNDSLIIDRILSLDVEGFFKVYYSRRVSMCGPGPVSALIVAAKNLGAKHVTKLKYATSGDTSGNMSSVVGYSSIAFLR